MRTAVIASAATDTYLGFIFEADIFGHIDENGKSVLVSRGL